MQASDAVLVHQSQSGDRQAFAEIVRRYQGLIASIALSATGNLTVGEELAHETFVAAWRSLGTLKDPGKLRPWLCGIARNLTNNYLRKHRQDLLFNADGIDNVHCPQEQATDPAESSIAQEEVELLNRTLASLPATYREPLVLFYREEQSVARVAELLELTPSAVKQRLARGRELLRDEVAAVVERGLLRSAPGRAFTLGVLAAIPIMSGSAKAATLTATTAKGVGLNAGTIVSLTGVLLGPVVGILGGWFGYKATMQSARGEQERRFIRRMTRWIIALIVLCGFGISTLMFFGERWSTENPTLLAVGIATLSLAYVGGITGTVFYTMRRLSSMRKQRAQQADGEVDSLETFIEQMPRPLRTFQYARRYESRWKLLGLPLIAVRFGGAEATQKQRFQPARGWIAIGDFAQGILFACGSCFAVGGFAMAPISVGVVAFGGAGIGLLAIGGLAMGCWAVGGFALGWIASGGIALAWKAATGGLVVAHEFGVGAIAVANQANVESAQSFLEHSRFFTLTDQLHTSPWVWGLFVLLAFVPILIAVKLVPPSRKLEDA